jgi:flagellar basal-body rod protein FlgB
MFSTDGILGRNFAISSAALDGLAKRQQLHTENLANVDTKGYRAKTVDFESVLGTALKDPNPGIRWSNPMATSASLRDAAEGGAISSEFNVTTRAGQPGVDRTKEVALMANDNIRFRVITQQVTNQISALRSVIAEMGRG